MRKLKRSERPEGFAGAPKSAIFYEISVNEMAQILCREAMIEARIPKGEDRMVQIAFKSLSISGGVIALWKPLSK